jgi:hypothetical protein
MMNNSIRTGTMIALASATLFAVACNKAKEGSPPADKMEAREPVKPAGAPPATGAPAAGTPAAGTPAAGQPEKVAKVHCGGVNECKGKSGCHSEKNACAGQNGCKGQGYIELTAEDCQSKGGKILAEK